MNIPQNDDAKEEEFLNKLAAEIGEHYDAVRIFVTRQSNQGTGNTITVTTGSGNVNAQVGMVAMWLQRQEEIVRDNVRKQEDEE